MYEWSVFECCMSRLGEAKHGPALNRVLSADGEFGTVDFQFSSSESERRNYDRAGLRNEENRSLLHLRT